MYKSFSGINVSDESFINIVHFIVGVLIKYKFVGFSEINIDRLFTAPKEIDLKIAHNFLEEINAKNLINNDKALDEHIQNLYKILKEKMEKSLNTSEANGEKLLHKLREM